MRLLLDTHVLLWWLSDDESLGADHRRLIAEPRNTVLVSAVTIAELAITASSGKLIIPDQITGDIASAGFDELPLTAAHAHELRHLPLHHRDPFDRMLICQARVEGIPILTTDAAFRLYDLELR